MHRKFFVKIAFPLGISMAMLVALAAWQGFETPAHAASDLATQGLLQAIDASGKPAGLCPLKHTDVKAEISGFLSRVTVEQQFENPFKEQIEAVYVFPLPQNAAVDDMTMQVGERTVRGRILRREEAQSVYQTAKSNGQVASLLDQERPNVFTQSVANIMPGERITVTISYVETLKYEDGTYEFVFPMVVGQRYIPGTPTGQQQQGGGTSPDTTRVPDASRITPPRASQGTRAGHDISIEVSLDAGVPIDSIKSNSHQIDVDRRGSQFATVRLKKQSVIPNKDFILKYDVAGRRIEDAVLTHRDEKGGFFTLILQPPDRVTVEDVTPKELVFVLDTSGSMEGFPIEKAKETMKLALNGLYPQDTFNLITFAGDTRILFPKPVPATKENLQKAQTFLSSRAGSGGTEMMKAIRTALAPSDAQDHVRIVCFMTDGEVGNDMEIIAEVQAHPNARVFSFGIGSSVNRFLLDKMAEYGRGEVEYVTLSDDGSAAARRFHERVRNPLLTDISVDWAGLPVADVYPKRIPDLFSAKPVILTGRYTGKGRGVIRLKGKMSGRSFEREIPVELPETEPQHDVLAKLWARTRMDDLMGQDYKDLQHAMTQDAIREAITQLGLEYRLMTQFTSFVAVEEMIVTDGGQPLRIDVPVEVPEGVKFDENTIATDVAGQSVVVTGAAGQNVVTVTDVAQIDQSSTAVGSNLNDRLYENIPVQRSESRPSTLSPSATDTSQSSNANPSIAGGSANDNLYIADGVNKNTSSAGNAESGKDAKEAKQSEGAGGPGEGGGAGLNQGRQVFSIVNPVTKSVENERTSSEEQPSPEEQKRKQLLAKLHPSLVAVLTNRLINKDAKPGLEEAKFVRDGKALVKVWLADKSPEVIEQLKQLGFEVVLDPKTAKLVVGRISLDKLEALAELKAVSYVAPQVISK